MAKQLTKTQDTVLNGIVRHILTAGGGALVTKGIIGQTERGRCSGGGLHPVAKWNRSKVVREDVE